MYHIQKPSTYKWNKLKFIKLYKSHATITAGHIIKMYYTYTYLQSLHNNTFIYKTIQLLLLLLLSKVTLELLKKYKFCGHC